LNYAEYRELFAMVEPDICPKICTNHTIPSHTRLQMALRFMAQGPMYLTNCDVYGVSKRSMSVHINSVFAAIASKVNFALMINQIIIILLSVYLVDGTITC
jgi:hypothetical protein